MRRIAASALLGVLGLAITSLLFACGGSDAGTIQRSTENLQPVDFALDWSGPEYMGFYIAQTMGYYADRGLNVRLLPGAGSAAASEGILDGSIGFGTVSANAVIREIVDRAGSGAFATESVPHIPAIIFSQSPSVIITGKNRRISKPQDLAGLKIGYTSEVAEAYRQFIELLGLNPGLEEQITLQEDLLQSTRKLKEGEIDALVTYMMDVPPVLEVDGFQHNATLLSDLGLNVPSQCIFVGSSAQISPETLSAFIDASCEGWDYVRRNPENAAKLFEKMLPGQDVEKIGIVARHCSSLLPPRNASNITQPYTDPSQLRVWLRGSIDVAVDARGLGWSDAEREALVAALTNEDTASATSE